jgi:molybdate transport system substrate-binding protein
MSARSSIATVSLLAFVGCTRGGAGDGTGPNAEKPPLKVAAASDLARAFTDVGEAYTKKTGQKVVFSFGSTGLLTKQIQEGAPFDVFAAANRSYVDEAVNAGACRGETAALYARGRIVVWTKSGEAPALEALRDAKYTKIAIANPEHAPYGRAAKEALERTGVWGAVAPKMVYGENVQQTLQFAQTGNADVAIVALALAMVSDGRYAPVDTALHAPLDQALVVCKGGPGSREFVAFVNGEEGRAVMRRYGFLLPGESTWTLRR